MRKQRETCYVAVCRLHNLTYGVVHKEKDLRLLYDSDNLDDATSFFTEWLTSRFSSSKSKFNSSKYRKMSAEDIDKRYFSWSLWGAK